MIEYHKRIKQIYEGRVKVENFDHKKYKVQNVIGSSKYEHTYDIGDHRNINPRFSKENRYMDGHVYILDIINKFY